MQVSQRRQSLSTDALENPSLRDDPGGADTANAADRERQEAVRKNLDVWDAAGLAVGECFPLTNAAEAATLRRTNNFGKRLPFFLYRNGNMGCVPNTDNGLRGLTFPLVTGDTEKHLASYATSSSCHLNLQPGIMTQLDCQRLLRVL